MPASINSTAARPRPPLLPSGPAWPWLLPHTWAPLAILARSGGVLGRPIGICSRHRALFLASARSQRPGHTNPCFPAYERQACWLPWLFTTPLPSA